MLTLLSGLWNRVWGYVIIVGAVLGALGAAYLKGRSEMRREVERRVLKNEVATRRQADAVRDDVARVDDPNERLRRDWSRPGS